MAEWAAVAGGIADCRVSSVVSFLHAGEAVRAAGYCERLCVLPWSGAFNSFVVSLRGEEPEGMGPPPTPGQALGQDG